MWAYDIGTIIISGYKDNTYLHLPIEIINFRERSLWMRYIHSDVCDNYFCTNA